MDSYFSRIIGEFTGNELSGLLLPVTPVSPFNDMPDDSALIEFENVVDEEPAAVDSGFLSDKPDAIKKPERYENAPETRDQRIPDIPVREKEEEMRKGEPEITAGKERFLQEVAYPSMEKEHKETSRREQKPDSLQSNRLISSPAEENAKETGSGIGKDRKSQAEVRGVMDKVLPADRGKTDSVSAGKEGRMVDPAVLPGKEAGISHKGTVHVIKNPGMKSRIKKGIETEVQEAPVKREEKREVIQEEIPELNPSDPLIFPDRTKPQSQTRLVIGRLTVEIVRQEEQKPLTVPERERIVYHHIPVMNAVPDIQPAIKVKYGLGQL